MTQNVIITHEGAASPDELNWEAPVLYQGSTPLYDKSNDPSRNILNSRAIPPTVTQQLTQIKGKCLLSRSQEMYQFAHIFSAKASYVDALERICYLEYRDDTLIVGEYCGTRTAKYSAYYPLLCSLLREVGFPELENRKFQIPNGQISKLVELINRLIQLRNEGRLELRPVQEIDVISLMKVQRYFYKAFWQMRPVDHDSKDEYQETELPIQKQASMFFDRIVENLKCAKTIEELKYAKAELNWLKEEIATIDDLAQSLENYLQRKKHS